MWKQYVLLVSALVRMRTGCYSVNEELKAAKTTYKVGILVVVLVADIPSETEEALLVVLLAMFKQLIVTIEALLAESALGMALEA